MDNPTLHEKILYELSETYISKNSDYGDSFGKSIREHGLIASVVRLEDKMNRITSLVKSSDIKVKSESIEDTLLDMANYAIMTVMEIRKKATK